MSSIFFLERFWSKVLVKAEDDCWPWLASTINKGYGQMQTGRTVVLSHRLSFELQGCPIEASTILHTCDNRLCCNPKHLKEGSAQDNTADMDIKGRGWWSNFYDRIDKAAIIEEYEAGGISQRQLAKKYGVSQTAIYKIVSRMV